MLTKVILWGYYKYWVNYPAFVHLKKKKKSFSIIRLIKREIWINYIVHRGNISLNIF